MNNKIYSQRNIPFTWEKNHSDESETLKKYQKDHHHRDGQPIKLPPPPCPPPEKDRPYIKIPLPPCAFQPPPPPTRSLSKRGLKRIDDDPFLIAYKEVTKTDAKEGNHHHNRKDQQGFNGLIKKNMSIFSCKQSSCVVTDESIIKMAQLPFSRSHRDDHQ